jgi:uncharacterized membrane protein YbjE (DUF340 family)
MIYFIEILLSIIEPLLFFFGIFASYVLGSTIYRAVNSFLYSFNTPCIEMVSLLIAVIAPVAFFYGFYHKKFFSHRSNQHNFFIFVLSFAFGTIMTFLPINYTINNTILYCPQQTTIMTQIAQSISTGLITAFLTYISLDLGVFYVNFVFGKISRKKKTRKRK